MSRPQLSEAEWEFISPFLPVGEYGPYPENLRAHFEGVVWRFRNVAKWWDLLEWFGRWSTVYGRFRQWRDAGVFTAVFQGAIAEAAKRGLVDLSLVSVDSTTVRAHHDAAGMIMEPGTLDAVEKAAAEKGAPPRNKTGDQTQGEKSDDA
ncbi:transposase [Streptomyces sp. NPDC059092]|uniref:transposase n=1 Tax=Streptomyces sp. NPDC059092 TaxID=3346725 RepID=UPI0036D1CD9E